RTLERAGLLRRTVQGRTHRCTLETAPLAQAEAWLRRYASAWRLLLLLAPPPLAGVRKARLHGTAVRACRTPGALRLAGRVGVGASRIDAASRAPAARAPIPAFPRKRGRSKSARLPAPFPAWGGRSRKSDKRVPTKKVAEPACKPGSVVDSHSSRRIVTDTLEQPTRRH